MELLHSLFRHLRWQDIFDIAINSYIVFRLYVLFRGTRMLRVLALLALLWVGQRIAATLGLIITSWGMQGIIAAAALIIVIVFRDEIRSVLQTKNLKALLWGLPHDATHTPVEVIAESVFAMAAYRTGALLVFPARGDLSGVVQKGLPWHGVISREMLVSIFWPDNPVHDGAAIIEGDRVTEVGAILPLSPRTDLPSHYGTRHRAAAGLAEASDALTIVVSEERGEVVTAHNAKLNKIQTPEELERILQQHLGLATTKSRPARLQKTRITAAAVCAVLLVSGIWYSFAKGLEALTTLEVPVEYMNRSGDLQIIDTSVNVVELRLSGPGPIIRSIRRDQVNVKLDLSRAVNGANAFTLTNANISLPPGLRLQSVEPAVVEVTLDASIEKELPIQIDWVGKLPEHLILAEVKLEPQTARVTGGKSILTDLETLYTEKVPLNGLRESGSRTVSFALHPASLRIAPQAPDKVEIHYTLRQR
jgi:uncharacterized protein (TIGR00159 family)